MQYTISSRGRAIGTTDLDFCRIDESARSGWFHPNALGEELMPIIAMALPAMRAFVCRNGRDEDGRSIVQPSFRRSSMFADLAEAFHHIQALDLTLHHADGALIPTTQIGIQDTEQLLELARQSEQEEADSATWDAGETELEYEEDLEAFGHDIELLERGWDESSQRDLHSFSPDAWIPDDEPSELPRYQVHLFLAKENAIP